MMSLQKPYRGALMHGKRTLQMNSLHGRMRQYHKCAACGIEYGTAGKAKNCAINDRKERAA